MAFRVRARWRTRGARPPLFLPVRHLATQALARRVHRPSFRWTISGPRPGPGRATWLRHPLVGRHSLPAGPRHDECRPRRDERRQHPRRDRRRPFACAPVESGRAVPDDVAVVGFDDTCVSAAADPPLTSIHRPLGDMGARLRSYSWPGCGRTLFRSRTCSSRRVWWCASRPETSSPLDRRSVGRGGDRVAAGAGCVGGTFQRVVPEAPSRPQGGGRRRHGDREVLALQPQTGASGQFGIPTYGQL
ncbi:substrate-binding domain-containing protein [Streptomyces rectiviolaceus]|uniref:substrate-binding domain-containing protein n=1 Tax=Streptomyces rectiviolaceus TaxID=332591 RepID=UPI003631BD32